MALKLALLLCFCYPSYRQMLHPWLLVEGFLSCQSIRFLLDGRAWCFPLFTVNPCIHYYESRDCISSNLWLGGSSSYANLSVIFLIKGQCMNSLILDLSSCSPLERSSFHSSFWTTLWTVNKERPYSSQDLISIWLARWQVTMILFHRWRDKRGTRNIGKSFRVSLFARQELAPHAPTLFLASHGCARGVLVYSVMRRGGDGEESEIRSLKRICRRFKLHNTFATWRRGKCMHTK